MSITTNRTNLMKIAMEAVKKGSDFYIPTYVINMKERLDRKKHIIGEFKGRDEFDVTYMDACTHKIGAVGLWNSIVRIIRLALENEDDVVVICEDDHYFTEDYSKSHRVPRQPSFPNVRPRWISWKS